MEISYVNTKKSGLWVRWSLYLQEWVGELQVPASDCMPRLVEGDDPLLVRTDQLRFQWSLKM